MASPKLSPSLRACEDAAGLPAPSPLATWEAPGKGEGAGQQPELEQGVRFLTDG